MTQEEKESIRKKIEEDIKTLKAQIETPEEKVKPIAPDCSLGRITRLQNALLRIEKPIFGSASNAKRRSA